MDSIKSQERVKGFGEVFTPDSIVNDMLTTIDNEIKKECITESEYITKTYLEPACGNGNFIIRILDRKLGVISRLPIEQQQLAIVKAVSSIYGIDIQEDNIKETKERMLQLIKNGFVPVLELSGKDTKPFETTGFELTPEVEKVLRFILDLNIQQGNALTGSKWEKSGESNKPLIITEYIFNNEVVTRKEIEFNNLIEEGNILYNTYVKEYEPVNYLELANAISKGQEQEDDDEFDF